MDCHADVVLRGSDAKYGLVPNDSAFDNTSGLNALLKEAEVLALNRSGERVIIQLPRGKLYVGSSESLNLNITNPTTRFALEGASTNSSDTQLIRQTISALQAEAATGIVAYNRLLTSSELSDLIVEVRSSGFAIESADQKRLLDLTGVYSYHLYGEMGFESANASPGYREAGRIMRVRYLSVLRDALNRYLSDSNDQSLSNKMKSFVLILNDSAALKQFAEAGFPGASVSLISAEDYLNSLQGFLRTSAGDNPLLIINYKSDDIPLGCWDSTQQTATIGDPHLTLRNFTIDGNVNEYFENMERQKSAAIILKSDTALPGRLRAALENMQIRRTAGDGISVRSADIRIGDPLRNISVLIQDTYRSGIGVVSNACLAVYNTNLISTDPRFLTGLRYEPTMTSSGRGFLPSELRQKISDSSGNSLRDVALSSAERATLVTATQIRSQFVNLKIDGGRGAYLELPEGSDLKFEKCTLNGPLSIVRTWDEPDNADVIDPLLTAPRVQIDDSTLRIAAQNRSLLRYPGRFIANNTKFILQGVSGDIARALGTVRKVLAPLSVSFLTSGDMNRSHLENRAQGEVYISNSEILIPKEFPSEAVRSYGGIVAGVDLSYSNISSAHFQMGIINSKILGAYENPIDFGVVANSTGGDVATSLLYLRDTILDKSSGALRIGDERLARNNSPSIALDNLSIGKRVKSLGSVNGPNARLRLYYSESSPMLTVAQNNISSAKKSFFNSTSIDGLRVIEGYGLPGTSTLCLIPNVERYTDLEFKRQYLCIANQDLQSEWKLMQ